MPPAAKLYSDVVPIAGLVGCATLALALTPSVIATGMGVLLAGVAVRTLLVRNALRA
jgi:hypothetical protein